MADYTFQFVFIWLLWVAYPPISHSSWKMVSLLGAINYESTALRVDGCRQKPNLSLVEQTENCLFGFPEISSKWFRAARWQVESNLIFHAFAERAGLAMIRRLAKQLIDATMKCIHYRQALENLISISIHHRIGQKWRIEKQKAPRTARFLKVDSEWQWQTAIARMMDLDAD